MKDPSKKDISIHLKVTYKLKHPSPEPVLPIPIEDTENDFEFSSEDGENVKEVITGSSKTAKRHRVSHLKIVAVSDTSNIL